MVPAGVGCSEMSWLVGTVCLRTLPTTCMLACSTPSRGPPPVLAPLLPTQPAAQHARLAQDGEVVSRDVDDLAVLAQVVPAGAVRQRCARAVCRHRWARAAAEVRVQPAAWRALLATSSSSSMPTAAARAGTHGQSGCRPCRCRRQTWRRGNTPPVPAWPTVHARLEAASANLLPNPSCSVAVHWSCRQSNGPALKSYFPTAVGLPCPFSSLP